MEHGAFSWPVGTAPADESLATPGTSADVVLLRTDTAFLELFRFQSPAPQARRPGRSGAESLRWASPEPAGPIAAVDLGVNHVCLDVAGIETLREDDVLHWHHPLTESSGGVAAVCYGTTSDGVVVELLESRSPDAFFARGKLLHG